MTVTTLGIDLAKSVFQLHGVDASGAVVPQKKLRRGAELASLAGAIRTIERQLMAWHRASAASQPLETIPGVGLITATAIAANVPDASAFRSGRQFAAWLDHCRKQIPLQNR